MLDKFLQKLISDKKKHFGYFIIILIALLILSYFWFPIYTVGDSPFHFRRLDILINALLNGDFPIYFDHETIEGYGYYTKAFYPDFIFIPFALIGIYTGPFYAYDIIIYTMAFL